MARIMTLDGLDQARVSEIRARLGQPELSWWRQPVTLQGPIGISNLLWLAAVGGLIGGAWLAARRRKR